MYAGHYDTTDSTSGTTPIQWWAIRTTTQHTVDVTCGLEYDLYATAVSAWKEAKIVLPKWWRWFDVFRTWAKPKLMRPLLGVQQTIVRVQERSPICQRLKQKRRAYVQRLHAL